MLTWYYSFWIIYIISCYLFYVLSFEESTSKMYDFTINMYIGFEFVDSFYIMIYTMIYDMNLITLRRGLLMIMYNGFMWWLDVIRTRWWLRSTTSSYGRSVVETAYGEIMSHSTETVWEILARKKWLGFQHDASAMFDILGSKPV